MPQVRRPERSGHSQVLALQERDLMFMPTTLEMSTALLRELNPEGIYASALGMSGYGSDIADNVMAHKISSLAAEGKRLVGEHPQYAAIFAELPAGNKSYAMIAAYHRQ